MGREKNSGMFGEKRCQRVTDWFREDTIKLDIKNRSMILNLNDEMEMNR